MKKIILLGSVFLTACGSFLPTPNDFPPPMTVIVQNFPTVFVTSTIEPRPSMITQDDMQEASNFSLILLTRVVSGDSLGVAEMVKYPITINLDTPIVIASAEEFEQNYVRIFNEELIDVIANISDADLTLLPEGIRVGQGEIWFNLYCVDLTCSDTEFFITQINP
jgi:hypothetical protein